MAVPKKKMSRSRTRRRKAAWKVAAPVAVACERCSAPKRPHRVCRECGHYGGRKVVETG